MSRIYIIGFMGVGKSTVGKKLANKLGFEFLDTDKVFEKKYKLSINNFFNKYGEELFRKLEGEILQSTFQKENCVISTGGGLPCSSNAISDINRNGVSIFLKMESKAIHSRLRLSKQKRPLLQSLSDDELLEFIDKKLVERNKYYQMAKISVPALSINLDQLVKDITDLTGK